MRVGSVARLGVWLFLTDIGAFALAFFLLFATDSFDCSGDCAPGWLEFLWLSAYALFAIVVLVFVVALVGLVVRIGRGRRV